MKMIFSALLTLLIVGGQAFSQDVEVVQFDRIEELMNQETEKVTVINFWATWCGPCIKELPYFEAININYGNQVRVVLVSLDFVENMESRVKPFLKKKDIQSEVILLDNIDYNSWIDKVDKQWSGAIPATLILDPNGTKKFFEKTFTREELETEIKRTLNDS